MPGWWHRERERPPSTDGGPAGEDATTAVAVPLEDAIAAVLRAAHSCVAAGPGAPLADLQRAIASLDNQTELGDDFRSRMIGGRYGGQIAADPGVLGETSFTPMAEEVLDRRLAAQVTMVKAAKAFVARPGADTATALQAALSEIASLRPPPGDDAAAP